MKTAKCHIHIYLDSAPRKTSTMMRRVERLLETPIIEPVVSQNDKGVVIDGYLNIEQDLTAEQYTFWLLTIAAKLSHSMSVTPPMLYDDGSFDVSCSASSAHNSFKMSGVSFVTFTLIVRPTQIEE